MKLSTPMTLFATPYTGKERDSESGNDYFGARYYGSTLGRFLSPDEPFVDQSSTDPQSWNLYGYVRNNPLTNIDPDGQNCLFVGEQSGTGVAQVTTVSGSCPSGIGSGISVPGTVDQSSFSYNGQQLSFGYTPYGGGDYTFGSGVPGYSSSTDSFASGSMAAALFGAGGRPYFNPAAGTVNAIGQVGITALSIAMPDLLSEAAVEGGLTGGVELGEAAANRISHIFQAKHKLGGLVQTFGGKQGAYEALLSATEKAVAGSAGAFETVVQIGGESVTVRGAVIDNAVRISTAFIR